jgi:hypothetical protein
MKTFQTSHECGFVSKPCRSEAQADYALRRHRCEKYVARAESSARRLARSAAVDRSRKQCPHKQAAHVHGTHACYVLDACRCAECSAATAAYESQRKRQRAYGRQAYVDAEPTRQHVRSLMAAGVGLKRIVEVSGVSQGALWKLMYGKRGRDGVQIPSRRILWETAVRLQVVRADINTLADGARISSLGVHRRVQSLIALGWSQTKLATRIGMNNVNFGHMMRSAQITVRTARAVVAM